MIYTEITASSPFIEADLNLSSAQMSMFIKGLKYVTPCQSRFFDKSIQDIVTQQFTTLSTIVKSCLSDNHMWTTNQLAKEAFPSLEQIVYQLQSKKLPRKLGIRAQREHAIVKSIQRLLRNRPDIIVRRTDKSKVFYVGNTIDFVRKASEYMLRTEAYQEITSGGCPLANNLQSVRTLIDHLWKKNAIDKDLQKKMLPNMNTLELAHLHFIPKPHKVIFLLNIKYPQVVSFFHSFVA
jgi:hypothetical protein